MMVPLGVWANLIEASLFKDFFKMSLLSLYILFENSIYVLYSHIDCKAINANNPIIVNILICLLFIFLFAKIITYF